MASSIAPLISFKAGKCDLDTHVKPYKVTPLPEPGYIYLYLEDDLIHFCWRERNAPLTDPELDLVMVPSDGHFVPYESRDGQQPHTNGRIFALKFLSSSTRYIFWLQSKPQGSRGSQDPSYLSPRDRKIGEIVDALLQGEEVDVVSELRGIREDGRGDDDDTTMEDSHANRSSNEPHGGSGGAGADATGGDVREEGEDAREGGADGARA